MVQHIRSVLGLTQHPRADVCNEGFLAKVETHHVRHIRVDGLVVRDSGADGVGDRHVSGAIDGQKSRNPERRIGPERQRIEEVVVDTTIDDVDPLRALSGAHVDHVIANEEVLPLDQLDSHLLGQEGVLEVGAVVGAGRQQDHGRVRHSCRCDAFEILQQDIRVVLHRHHRMACEQLGEEPHHHLSVLEHVRHA